MSRPVLLLFLGLAAALAGFGLLADRALVREAAASAELSSARSEQDARAAALSVRGTLGQIEQDLLAGRNPAGVRQQTLALPPSLSVWSGRPYRGRPREELISLLLSTDVTPWGLPEAVVAAIALGGPESRRDVAERLLAGQLPVRPEDLRHLASLMAVGGDPRVADLQSRLRSAPDANDLPEAPGFRRTAGIPVPVLMLTAKGDIVASSAWSWAPTTTCPSRSRCTSCWRGCAPCSGARAARSGRRRRRWCSAASDSTFAP